MQPRAFRGRTPTQNPGDGGGGGGGNGGGGVGVGGGGGDTTVCHKKSSLPPKHGAQKKTDPRCEARFLIRRVTHLSAGSGAL
ncbi:hypothetical protein Ga0100231_014150 [Opitutaceae bacterium TAV4]|nr:hypothetical protein Ga0100231_014150 [Opitutaceae bacterium TAV4]